MSTAVPPAYDGPERDRVRAAIDELSDGDAAARADLVAMAMSDYRDVLAELDRRRSGAPVPDIDLAALQPWATGEPATTGTSTGPCSVIVTELTAGSPAPELIKQIRQASGLGVADVADLLERLPARVATGLSQDSADELAARLTAAGARAAVDLRP